VLIFATNPNINTLLLGYYLLGFASHKSLTN
jgi:hypothetical protein